MISGHCLRMLSAFPQGQAGFGGGSFPTCKWELHFGTINLILKTKNNNSNKKTPRVHHLNSDSRYLNGDGGFSRPDLYIVFSWLSGGLHDTYCPCKLLTKSSK